MLRQHHKQTNKEQFPSYISITVVNLENWQLLQIVLYSGRKRSRFERPRLMRKYLENKKLRLAVFVFQDYRRSVWVVSLFKPPGQQRIGYK